MNELKGAAETEKEEREDWRREMERGRTGKEKKRKRGERGR